MLYWIAWVVVKLSLKLSFEKIEVRGLQHIPKNGPVIFTCNHPVGFLEPLVLATHLPRSLYYLARGDFFRKPIARFFLGQIHILPIYRFRDGFVKLRNNQQAMQNAIDLIVEGKSFLVFVEGSTELQYSYRAVQKGVSRIVYDLLLQYPTEKIAIVPIGFTDSNMTSLGSKIYVNIGVPLCPVETFNQGLSKPKFLRKLTDQIQQACEKLVPQLENHRDDLLLQTLMPTLPESYQNLDAMQMLAQQLNEMSEEDKQAINTRLETYQQRLVALSVSKGAPHYRPSIMEIFLLLFGSIPAVVGKISHVLPLSLAKYFADKKVVNPQFYMVIQFVAQMVSMIVFYLLLTVVLHLTGIEQISTLLMILIVLGVYAEFYWKVLERFWNRIKLGNKRRKMLEEHHSILSCTYDQ